MIIEYSLFKMTGRTMLIYYILTVFFVSTIQCDSKVTKPKIYKCCDLGQYVGVTTEKYGSIEIKNKKVCMNGTYDIDDMTLYDNDRDTAREEKNLSSTFDVIPGKFYSDKNFHRLAANSLLFQQFNLYVTENANLYLEMPNAYDRWTKVENTNFCVDYYMNKVATRQFWLIFPKNPLESRNEKYLTAAMFVSSFFLLLVLIVYSVLQELRNLCGQILMAYVASLLTAIFLLAILRVEQRGIYVCYGLRAPNAVPTLINTNITAVMLLCFVNYIRKLVRNRYIKQQSLRCRIYPSMYFFIGAQCIQGYHDALVIYFALLASFCWMNVMSYDIWWTFRGYAKARPIHRRGEPFKYLMYSLYAWGLPLAMTIMLATVDRTDLRRKPWIVKPNLQKTGSFIEGGEKLYYLYCPMLILICTNWLFFLMTAFNIWRLSRGTSVLDSAAAGTPAAHRSNRQRFLVYLKLTVVMGLNWLLEVVSFLLPNDSLWFISDYYNILIGVSIFLIFVCKRKILRKLAKVYLQCRNRGLWHPGSNSRNNTTSEGSSGTSGCTETETLKVCANPKGPGYVISNNF